LNFSRNNFLYTYNIIKHLYMCNNREFISFIIGQFFLSIIIWLYKIGAVKHEFVKFYVCETGHRNNYARRGCGVLKGCVILYKILWTIIFGHRRHCYSSNLPIPIMKEACCRHVVIFILCIYLIHRGYNVYLVPTPYYYTTV